MHWIDPDSLPELQGTIERFVLNPHGEIDGFVMLGEREARGKSIHSVKKTLNLHEMDSLPLTAYRRSAENDKCLHLSGRGFSVLVKNRPARRGGFDRAPSTRRAP